MGTISNTLSLLRATSRVICADKEILVLAVGSTFAAMAVGGLIGLVIRVIQTTLREPLGYQVVGAVSCILSISSVFAFIFVFFYVDAAVTAIACNRMMGGNPTLLDGLRVARIRWRQLLDWMGLSLQVRLSIFLTRLLARKVGGLGGLVIGGVAWAANISWGIASFLTVPVIVMEGLGATAAVRRSCDLLSETWGEQLTGRFGLQLVGALLLWPAFGITIYGFQTGQMMVAWAGFLALIVLRQVTGAFTAVFRAALYLYARDGVAGEHFPPQLLASAMARS